jgi:5-methylcytosine-specific restriction endonuclease McrA
MCSTHYSYWYRRQSGQWGPSWDISRERRLAIYERDDWTCQLCGDPVDMDADPQRDDLAPSLDHIVPRSLQAIPDHSDQNLRLAHRGCNARRGARVDVVAS